MIRLFRCFSSGLDIRTLEYKFSILFRVLRVKKPYLLAKHCPNIFSSGVVLAGLFYVTSASAGKASDIGAKMEITTMCAAKTASIAAISISVLVASREWQKGIKSKSATKT